MSKFGDESILTQCYWTWETESKIVSFRKERQQPYSLEMEGGVGGIIFSRTVRPEILTQSCDNADLRILQIYSCISASTPNLLSSLQKWTLNIIEYEQMNILNLNWSKFILMVTLSSLLSSYPKNFSWAGKTGWVYYDTHWKKKTTLNSHLIIYGALDLLFGFAATKQTAGAPCFTATLQSSSARFVLLFSNVFPCM